MKTLCTAISCVLLFATLALHTPASAQGDIDGGNSIDTLHAAITKQTYTYIKGIYTLTIKFKNGGTGEGTDWKFKWRSKDAQTVEITVLDMKGKPTDKTATFTFSADYKTFAGVDPDGISKVTGAVVAAQ